MTVIGPHDPERPFWVVWMLKREARVCSAAARRSDMAEMTPLKGKRRAISARKLLILIWREYMGAVTTRENNGRRKRKEKSFIFVYLIEIGTSTSQLDIEIRYLVDLPTFLEIAYDIDEYISSRVENTTS
jgi:hypothetical protein